MLFPESKTPALDFALPSTWSEATEISDSKTAYVYPSPFYLSSEFSNPDWLQVFDDYHLAFFTDLVSRRNNSLKLALYNLELAHNQYQIAQGQRLPSLNLSLDGSRRAQNIIGLPLPGSEQGVFNNIVNSFSLGLNISWEIDLWGRLRALAESRELSLESQERDFDFAKLSLQGQAAKGYLVAVESALRVEELENLVDARQRLFGLYKLRYSAGLVREEDLTAARRALEQARSSLSLAKIESDSAHRGLEALMGVYPRAALVLAKQFPRLRASSFAKIPAKVISHRPDVQAALMNYRSQLSAYEAARLELLPRISLTSSGGTASNEFRDLSDGDFSVWSLAAGIAQPIFEGNRLALSAESAGIQAEQARINYVQQVIDSLAEVEQLLYAKKRYAERLESARASMAESIRVFSRASLRFERGILDAIPYRLFQIESIQDQLTVNQAQLALLTSAVDLYVAFGGLS